MEGRNRVFQRLKPPCVALSQSALGINGPKGNVQALTDDLHKLCEVLSSVTATPDALDVKLSDYVFFPLSQVLKASHKVSIRSLELTLQCLAILISEGWRKHIQPQLAAQIVILCTFLAEQRPKALAGAETSDELRTNAFLCLSHLFRVLENDSETRKTLISDANFPQLGQTFGGILDGITNGDSAEVQVMATEALMALVENVATRDIRASFLPGIVSRLTKVLAVETKQRRNHKVLIGALGVLSLLFKSTLSDAITNEIQVEGNSGNKPQKGAKKSTVIDRGWLDTAAAQLKPAITTIMRLKTHSRDDVKAALAAFCFIILNDCQKTLENCASSAMETLLILASNQHDPTVRDKLGAAISGNSSLLYILQETLHDWLQSLPTLMLSADEQAKSQKMQQVIAAYQIFVDRQAEIQLLNTALINVLRECVVAILQLQKYPQRSGPLISPLDSVGLGILAQRQERTEYGPPLIRDGAQREAMISIEQLVKVVSTSGSSPSFSSPLLRALPHARGDEQIATFWLLLNLAQSAAQERFEIDDLIEISPGESQVYNSDLEDLYSFSLDILTSSSDNPPDPRLVALALRTVALRAQLAGPDFRHELIDVLYPVLHTLATPDEELQVDSITTLNILTRACGYTSVKDLIVENVDYLTNAVALKLNAFEISPQAPQVLLMMVRLAGPSVLPYLEDTVESIFAVLEDYHGYPLLVQVLFRVLKVIAEEGSKGSQRALAENREETAAATAAAEIGSKWQPTSMSELKAFLQDRADRTARAEVHEDSVKEPHPREPWKATRETPRIEELSDDASDHDVPDDEHRASESSSNDGEEPPPPAGEDALGPPMPKTYGLVFKITELTQHFLPSASPALRASLLALIQTTTPALAQHENSFLPLINTLWPEIVSRLNDREPHVVAAALDLVGVLCEHARSFMRSRVLQLWPGLVSMHTDVVRQMVPPERQPPRGKTSAQRGDFSTPHRIAAAAASGKQLVTAVKALQALPASYDVPTRMLWTALTGALAKIVKYVPIPPDRFDEALEMLEPRLEDREVREALEAENPDAVWLVRLRKGAVKLPDLSRKKRHMSQTSKDGDSIRAEGEHSSEEIDEDTATDESIEKGESKKLDGASMKAMMKTKIQEKLRARAENV